MISVLKGKVLAVDSSFTDQQGMVIPQIFVVDDSDGGMIALPWLPIGPEQSMPLIGQTVIYWRQGNHDAGILKFYGTNGLHIRKGEFGLAPGEHVVQGDAGKAYTRYGEDGGFNTVTGDGATSVSGSSKGLKLESPAITIRIFGGLTIQMSEDGTFHIAKTTKSGVVKAEIAIDAQDSVVLSSQSNCTIKAPKIILDGNVVMGNGVSDPNVAAKAAPIVTAGSYGTHPLDLATGEAFEGTAAARALT